MRSPLLLLILAAGAWLGYVGLRAEEPTYSAPMERAPDRLSGVVPPDSVVRRFEVTGMCCESCPKKLHAQLAAMPGVSEASIDLDSATASVVVARTVPVEAIVSVLGAEPKYSVRPLP